MYGLGEIRWRLKEEGTVVSVRSMYIIPYNDRLQVKSW